MDLWENQTAWQGVRGLTVWWRHLRSCRVKRQQCFPMEVSLWKHTKCMLLREKKEEKAAFYHPWFLIFFLTTCKFVFGQDEWVKTYIHLAQILVFWVKLSLKQIYIQEQKFGHRYQCRLHMHIQRPCLAHSVCFFLKFSIYFGNNIFWHPINDFFFKCWMFKQQHTLHMPSILVRRDSPYFLLKYL